MVQSIAPLDPNQLRRESAGSSSGIAVREVSVPTFSKDVPMSAIANQFDK